MSDLADDSRDKIVQFLRYFPGKRSDVVTLAQHIHDLQTLLLICPESATMPYLVRDTSECGGGEVLRYPVVTCKQVDESEAMFGEMRFGHKIRAVTV